MRSRLRGQLCSRLRNHGLASSATADRALCTSVVGLVVDPARRPETQFRAGTFFFLAVASTGLCECLGFGRQLFQLGNDRPAAFDSWRSTASITIPLTQAFLFSCFLSNLTTLSSFYVFIFL
jgi:hypothetical protein